MAVMSSADEGCRLQLVTHALWERVFRELRALPVKKVRTRAHRTLDHSRGEDVDPELTGFLAMHASVDPGYTILASDCL